MWDNGGLRPFILGLSGISFDSNILSFPFSFFHKAYVHLNIQKCRALPFSKLNPALVCVKWRNKYFFSFREIHDVLPLVTVVVTKPPSSSQPPVSCVSDKVNKYTSDVYFFQMQTLVCSACLHHLLAGWSAGCTASCTNVDLKASHFYIIVKSQSWKLR